MRPGSNPPSPELEVLLPMLAIETRPLFLRLEGVPGVTAPPPVLPAPGVAGVRPPLEVLELPPPGVTGDGPPPLEPRTKRALDGVPGVRGVLAGVPGSKPAPGVPGVVLPPLPFPPCSMLNRMSAMLKHFHVYDSDIIYTSVCKDF